MPPIGAAGRRGIGDLGTGVALVADEHWSVEGLRDPLARTQRWNDGVRTVFEGLEVTFPTRDTSVGEISAHVMGPGRLAGIRGGPQHVARRARHDRTSVMFNVLIQLEGQCTVLHSGSRADLEKGDVCLVDGASNFDLDFEGSFRQLLFQFPRDLVLRRHDRLARSAGQKLPSSDGAPRVVHDTFVSLSRAIDGFNAEGRTLGFDACLSMLGVLQSFTNPSLDLFLRASSTIEAELSDPDLTAERIARQYAVSRRRLDQVFADRGTTVTGFIRERRLVRLAEVLRDPALVHRKIVDLAMAHGFNDAAHFSRAFRARFDASPRAWRAAQLASMRR